MITLRFIVILLVCAISVSSENDIHDENVDEVSLMSTIEKGDTSCTVTSRNQTDARRVETANSLPETIGLLETSITEPYQSGVCPTLGDDPVMVEKFKEIFNARGLNKCDSKTKCWCPSPGDVCYGGNAGGRFNSQQLGISSIPKGALRGLTSIGQLELNYNYITYLDEDVFDGLDSVTGIWLETNSLKVFPKNVFKGLTNLQTRCIANNLNKCQSASFPTNSRTYGACGADDSMGIEWGVPCTDWELIIKKTIKNISFELSCEKHPTTSKCGAAFKYNPTVGFPPITGKFSDISGGLFSSGILWTSLDLSGNNLIGEITEGDATSLLDSFKLKDLCNLSGNRELCTHSTPLAERCQLKLCNSNTPPPTPSPTTIPQQQQADEPAMVEFFKKHFTELGLNKCNVKEAKCWCPTPGDVCYGGLLIAGALRLIDKKLTSIPYEALRGLTNLYFLDLTSNKITFLQNGLFSGLTCLKVVILQDNPLDACQGENLGFFQKKGLVQYRLGTLASQREYDKLHFNSIRCPINFSDRVANTISEFKGLSVTTRCEFDSADNQCGPSLAYSPTDPKNAVTTTGMQTLREHFESVSPRWVSLNLSKNKISGSMSSADNVFFLNSVSSCDLSGNLDLCTTSNDVATKCKIKLCDNTVAAITGGMSPMRFVSGASGSTVTFKGNDITAGDFAYFLPVAAKCSTIAGYSKNTISAERTLSWAAITEPGAYHVCIQSSTSTSNISELKETVTIIATPGLLYPTTSKTTGLTESIVLGNSAMSDGDFVFISSSLCEDIQPSTAGCVLTSGCLVLKGNKSQSFSAILPEGMFSTYDNYNVCFATKETKGKKAVDYVLVSNNFFLTRQYIEICEEPKDLVSLAINFDLRTDVVKEVCANPPVANQGTCGNCYAWSATGQYSLTTCVRHETSMKVTMSAPMVSQCLTGCSGSHMDRVYDFVNSTGVFTCENEKNDGSKSGACKNGCLPISRELNRQYKRVAAMCPTRCKDDKEGTRVGRRSNWCGINALSNAEPSGSLMDRPHHAKPGMNLVNVMDTPKADTVSLIKRFLSSPGKQGALSTTLVLYADAVASLFDCKADPTNMIGVLCDDTWQSKLFPLLPETSKDFEFCKKVMPILLEKQTFDETAMKRCDCWSMLEGQAAVGETLRKKCGFRPVAHIVQIIGWKEEKIGDKVIKYWILQNQWGPTWGNKGFFYLKQGYNVWGVEDELYYYKKLDDKTDVKNIEIMQVDRKTNFASSRNNVERRTRRIRRMVGGWVESHHPTSPMAQEALKYLGGEFVGPSPALTEEEHVRACVSNLFLIEDGGERDTPMVYKRHRIVSVESAEIQIVAGLNHRFHVISQEINNDYVDSLYHRHRVIVHRRINGLHALLHVEHIETIEK